MQGMMKRKRRRGNGGKDVARPWSLQLKGSCYCHLPLLIQCFTETITAAAAAASKTAVPNTLETEPVTIVMNISIVVVIL